MTRSSRARWPFLLALGELSDTGIDGATEQWLATADPQRVFQLLVAHKICELALDKLRASSSPRIPRRLVDLLDARVARKARSYAETRSLAVAAIAMAREQGGRVMKGCELRDRYPRPELCHVGDVDFHFDELDQALRYATRLRADGWEWDRGEVPWMKWDDAGRPYGQWPMRRYLTADVRLRIDIHQGPYSFGHLGMLPLDEWGRARVEGVDVDVPSRRMALALTAAHCAGAAHVTVKEVNEIGLLAPTAEDWTWAAARCGAAGAGEPLAVLRRLAEHRRDPGAAISAGPPRRWGPDVPSRAARALAVTALTCRQRVAGSGLLRALALAPGASWYFLAGAPLRAAGGPLRASPLARRNRWTCWRLVPPGLWTEWPAGAGDRGARADLPREGGDAEVVFFPVRAGWLARVGDDVLLPTVSGRVPTAVVAAAHALRRPEAAAR